MLVPVVDVSYPGSVEDDAEALCGGVEVYSCYCLFGSAAERFDSELVAAYLVYSIVFRQLC